MVPSRQLLGLLCLTSMVPNFILNSMHDLIDLSLIVDLILKGHPTQNLKRILVCVDQRGTLWAADNEVHLHIIISTFFHCRQGGQAIAEVLSCVDGSVCARVDLSGW